MSRAAAQARIDPPRQLDLVARALGDATRRGLLTLVRDEEMAAGDLAERCPEISRPAVSQHLRVLSDAGLMSTRRDGNRRLYRARPEGLADVWRFVDDMWSDKLERLKRVAEQSERAAPQHRRKRSDR